MLSLIFRLIHAVTGTFFKDTTRRIMRQETQWSLYLAESQQSRAGRL